MEEIWMIWMIYYSKRKCLATKPELYMFKLGSYDMDCYRYLDHVALHSYLECLDHHWFPLDTGINMCLVNLYSHQNIFYLKDHTHQYLKIKKG